MLTSGNRDPAGLFVARDSAGRVCGAALAQVMPGALGLLWPPSGESPEAEDALVAAACDWLRERGVKVCQAFPSADEMTEMAPLERAGFRHITQLVFLRRDVDRPQPSDLLSPPARCCPWTREPTPELLRVLLATHDGTLDCPELNGGRTPAELLDGFRQERPTNCAWWHTIDEGGEPVGVLLLDAGSEPLTLDVSYLGVVPAVRGRGIGATVLRFAHSIAAASGYATLSLSVDARNTPALRLYRRHGFVETDCREVWLTHWPSLGEPRQ